MEEWSRKLKLLHWMCIERADGVSPLVCFDDDDDGGDDDGAETFEGGANFDSSPPDAGSTQETFEGGANFDSSPGGTQDSSTQETFEGGANFDSSPGGSGTGGGSNESVNDFASLDNSPAQGYADYGSNVEQGLGGSATAGSATAGSSTAAGQATTGDFLSSSQSSSITPDPPAIELPEIVVEARGKEGKEDEDSLAKDLAALGLNAMAQAPAMPGFPGGRSLGGTQVTEPFPENPAGFSFYGPGDIVEGQGTAGGAPGGTGADALGGGNIEQGSGAPGPETSGGGAPGGGGAAAGGGAATGGAGTGGAGTETAGLDSGAGSQGGGAQDSQGGGGSGGGIQDLFDIPMRAPSAKDREKELEREFQQQLAPPTPLPPPPTFAPARQAGGGIMDAITSALVGSAQAAPVSGRVSQAPIAPGTLPSGAVANPFGNPPVDPNKVQDQVPQGLPGITFTRDGRGKEKEDDLRDSPFGPQQAVNIYGMNINSPPGYNTAFSGLPGAQGAPQGAPPPDQQVAQGQPLGSMPITANPVPTQSITPPALVATGKGNLQSRIGQGRTDPFGKDAQNPDIFDPNISAPPVGMLMAGVRSGQPPPDWTPSTATAFGPRAPTQAQAPPRDPTIFDPTAVQSQVPSPLQGLQGTRPDPFGTPGGRLSGPTGQQTPFDVGPPAPPAQVAQAPPGPPGVAPRTGREGIAQPAPPYDPTVFNPGQMRATPTVFAPGALPPPGPVRVAQAPSPSQRIDTSGRDQSPWSTVPPPTVNAPPPVEVATPTPPREAPPREVPTREPILDPNANIVSSLAPMSRQGDVPTGQQGNPLAGGVPGSSTVDPSQQGGGAGTIMPAVLTAVQGELERRKGRPLTAQEKRNAITEALMRRDLNAPGVSDFDRLRLQP